MDIEFRHLRILRAVAEAGSLSDAANTLSMNQASIVRHLNRLERTVGLPLLERGRSGIRLTQSGELVLNKANIALPIVDKILATSGALCPPSRDNVVKIYTPQCTVLSPFVRIVKEILPLSEIELHIADTPASSLAALRDQQADIALLRHYDDKDPALEADVHSSIVASEPTILVINSSHRLAAHKSVELSALDAQRCVLPDSETHQLGQRFLSSCHATGTYPHVSHTTDFLSAAAIVAATDAVSPTYFMPIPLPRLIFRPLRHPGLTAVLTLAWTCAGPLRAHTNRIREALSAAHTAASVDRW